MVSQPILVPFIPSPTLGPLPINPAVTRLNSSPRRPISGHEKSGSGNNWNRRLVWPLRGSVPWPLSCGTKSAGAEGAPRRKGGEGHPRGEFWRRARLELGCSWRAGWAPGEAGLVPAPRAIRSASGARRSPFLSPRHFTFIPFHRNYYYYFPAQSRNLGLPKLAAEGPPFPGESAARASAPGAPERKPEGSARPRTLLRTGLGLAAARGAPLTARQPQTLAPGARVPGLTFSGAARPRTPVSSLHPAPPRPLHCQPGAAGARPGHPRRPPERPCLGSLGPCADHRPRTSPPLRPGVSLFPLCAPNSASPGALRSLGSSVARGRRLDSASLLFPPSSPKMPPAPRQPQEFYRFFSNPPLFPEKASWAA